MKKLIITTILSSGILLAGSVQAKNIDKNTEAHLVKVCEAIKSDSKISLYKAIEDSGISAKALGKGLVCNGYDPVTFAIVNNAQNTAKFMARRSDLDYNALLAKL
jgi:hypothetical protein